MNSPLDEIDIPESFLSPTNGEHQRCPHCKAKLTLREALSILHGDGFRRAVQIRLPDGEIVAIDSGEFNPLTMEMVD